MPDKDITIHDAKGKPMYLQNPSGSGKPTKGEVGFTGNKIFAGLPMDEYNRDLLFPKSTYIYDEMRKSDGQIAAVLAACTLPIRSTEWYVAPDDDADDAKLAEQVAEFVEDNLFGGMRYSFDDHLREALLMLVFGFSIFEVVWRFDTWQDKKVVMLDKYAPRVAPSIWRFPQDENYNIVSIEQINFMTGQMATIPLERCRVYTYNREGDNPIGISMLRPAYKHWYIKDALYKIVAVGIEKTSIGTPVATLPPGVSEEDRSEILDAITAIRTAEDGGITVPQGVVIDILEGKRNPIDAMPFIEHQDTMIARSVLAQFINLGTMSTASGGSYALGNTQVDMFTMNLEAVANYIQGEIQKDIEKLVTWNFGLDAPMPQLQHKNIGFRDMGQVAQALYWLGAGHLVTTDESLEDHIRELFGIPPIPREAMDSKLLLPADRYNPDTIPDDALNPTEQKAIQQRIQEASGGQSDSLDGGDGSAAGAATASANAAAMSEPIKLADAGLPQATNGEKPVPPGTDQWRRPLTQHEANVNLKAINDRWTSTEDKLLTQMQTVLRQASTDLEQQIERILNSGQSLQQQIQALQMLSPKYGGKYQNVIQSILMNMYEYGSQTVKEELGVTQGKNVAAPPIVADKAAIQAKAETIATLQMQKLTSGVKLAAIGQLERGVPTKTVIQNVKTTADAYVTGPDLKTAAMISVGEALNIGRDRTAKEVGVQGAQWSAVLDSHTCALCEELDGQVISADDPDFDVFTAPLHSGCRCIRIYVGSGQTNFTPDWKSPSKSLVQKYGQLIT